jgi:class 3 adenylate cyclase/tetratricopeptide (TPR) repeat protein/energy-coupling factor transporter ATP-binding protein EcfA2
MRCPKCQFENPDGSSFCLECGSTLESPCPRCGNALPASAKFFNKCGHVLRGPVETAPIDFNQPQSYTPKHLADKILKERSAIEGERKLVTVLFADVAGYTSMSEKLDPEEVHQIMDGCFKILMDETHKCEGTINQFTGDGVMALFGAPVAHEDHAQRACHAALSIQKSMGAYSEKVKNECGADFKLRIGLNAGLVIVGSIGDDLRMDYMAVGDTTNLASRMQSLAKPGGILGTGNIYRLARDFFEFEPLGEIQVKGKEASLEAYELIRPGKVGTRIEAATAKGLTKFVGRKRETSALKEAYEEARSGKGQVVGIVGEAGVGKSRLLLELRKVLPEADYVYLEGRCLHYGGSMPYLPILDILRSYFEIKEGDREFLIKNKMKDKVIQLDDKLNDLIPAFQELFSVKVDDENFIKLEPKEKRDRTFEAIRDLLIRVSQGKTLVLTIEDLHWIDRTTEEFLDYFIGWLATTPILLILLYRPEYTHQWGNKSFYTKIGVGQLSTNTSSELVQAILGDGDVVPELRELVLSKAGGNPLFVEEITHSLVENGSIQRKDQQFVLTRKASEIEVPDTIQGIIAARMDRVEESLKRIMQVASVIGREFAFRILQSIMGMREELKSQLLNLQGLEFIYEKSLFPELEYIFKHALTQEVAYNSLLQKRRKEIHERIGGAIEQIYAERLEEFYEMLAYHYLKSENSEKAYLYLKSSGDKAVRNYANREAFRFYKEAIEALYKMPETEENKRRQIEVRLSMWPPMSLLGYPEDSLQILHEGERLAEEIGDTRSLVIFYSKLSNCHAVTGNPLLGIQYSEKCFQEAEKIEDLDLMAPIAVELSVAYFVAGEFSKIFEMDPKVIALLEKNNRESEFFGRPFNVYAELHTWCGYSLANLGKFEEGEAFSEKSLRLARELNHLGNLAVAELFYGLSFLIKGEVKNTINHAKNAIKYSEGGEVPLFLYSAWTQLGVGHYLLGEFETALRHVQKGLKIQNDMGVPMYKSYVYQSMGTIHLDMGELKSAQSCAEKALILAQQNHEKSIEGLSLALLGRILGKKEPPEIEKAEAHIRRGIRISEELKLKPWVSQGHFFLGEIYADTDKRDQALDNLKKAEEMFQEMGMDYYLTKTQEVLDRLGRGG